MEGKEAVEEHESARSSMTTVNKKWGEILRIGADT